jgi:hypothetical protein
MSNVAVIGAAAYAIFEERLLIAISAVHAEAVVLLKLPGFSQIFVCITIISLALPYIRSLL